MPEERDMEKALRAWAKRRREDAGAPVELHPATRRLLQAEVSKLKGGPHHEQGRFARLLWGSPLRLVLNLSAVVALVVAAALILPQLRHAPFSSSAGQALLAENKPETSDVRQPASAVSEDLAKNQLGPAIQTEQPLRKDDTDKVAPAAKKLALADNLIYKAPEAPPAPAPPTAAPAPATPVALDHEYLGEKENAASVPLAAAAKAPASAAFVQQLSWTSVPANADRSGNLDAFYAGAPVLNNFRTEQTAEQFRVIDADGSVYAGTLIVSNETSTPHGERPSAQTRFFRVSGTNLTRHLPVVFTGQLVLGNQSALRRENVTVTNAAFDYVTDGGFGGGGGGFGGVVHGVVTTNGAVSSTNAMTFSGTAVQTTLSAGTLVIQPQSRVEGRAFIGTNEIQINAVPVSP